MKIIYKNPDNTVVVTTPTDAGLKELTINQIAEKDTPGGLPFWIREDSDIPADRTFRAAWEIDPAWGNPNGIGGE